MFISCEIFQINSGDRRTVVLYVTMSTKLIRVLSKSCVAGEARVEVGIFRPRQVFGEAVVQGDTSTIGAMEVLMRQAERIAGRRARRVLAREVPVVTG